MANIITAIDIGSFKITAVIAAIDDEGKAKVIGEASYPSYGVRKGEITGIDEVVDSIANALTGAERMAGITVSSAYVTINGRQITSNNNKGVVAISENEISKDDLIRSLEQARTVAIPPAREIIHLIPREYVVDQQSGIKDPTGMTGTRLEVDAHIISAPVTSIYNLKKCIQGIGLKIDDIVFSGWASTYSVLTPTEKELGVLLLDFGHGAVTINTFVDDAITYSTSIPFGGWNVTRDLAAGLRVSMDDAEKIKVNAEKLFKEADSKLKSKKNSDKDEEDSKDQKSDILDVSSLDIEGVKTVSRKEFTDYVNARVEEIFEYVRVNIEGSGYDYKLPAGIVITGGSAELPGITNIAKEVFGVPARIGIPRGLNGLVDGISTAGYSAVQGLIQYALDDQVGRFGKSSGEKKVSSKGGNGIADRVRGFFKNMMP